MQLGSKQRFCGPSSVLKELLFSYPVHYTHTHTSLLWFREDSAIDAQPVYSVLEVVPTMTEVETEMLADMDADSPFGLSYFSETGQMENQHQQCCHLMMASSTCFLVELDVQPKVGTFWVVDFYSLWNNLGIQLCSEDLSVTGDDSYLVSAWWVTWDSDCCGLLATLKRSWHSKEPVPIPCLAMPSLGWAVHFSCVVSWSSATAILICEVLLGRVTKVKSTKVICRVQSRNDKVFCATFLAERL